MMRVKEIKDKQIWEEFNQRRANGYFLQSWDWGEFQEKHLNRNIFRLGVFNDEDYLKAIALVIVEEGRLGKFLYIPRGPITDWNNFKESKEVLERIKQHFADSGYMLLKIDPAIVKDNDKVIKMFKDQDFKTSPMPIQVEYPWMLDIEGRSDEELFEWMKEHGMRKKVPNYIRGAERKGVEIKIAQNIDDVKIFTKMLMEMGKAIDIDFGTEEYYINLYKHMPENLKILLGYYKDKPVVSAGVMMYNNEASYLYGASTPDIGNSNASYLLQWEAIKNAREKGVKRYNFWGVLTGKDYNKASPAYGYSYFKRSFGGYIEPMILPQEFVYDTLKYPLYKLQQVYRKYRAKKKGSI
jgi:lipid II:glycine glycyltransferase (peptidoglycan interpeptide bridge formation enzyme)